MFFVLMKIISDISRLMNINCFFMSLEQFPKTFQAFDFQVAGE